MISRDGRFAAAAGGRRSKRNMRRALPDARFVDLDLSHPIFHSFFEVKSLLDAAGLRRRRRDLPRLVRGQRSGQAAADDRQLQYRYLAILEWSGTGLRPIADTNESYKLGVNYIVYGLTH